MSLIQLNNLIKSEINVKLYRLRSVRWQFVTQVCIHKGTPKYPEAIRVTKSNLTRFGRQFVCSDHVDYYNCKYKSSHRYKDNNMSNNLAGAS